MLWASKPRNASQKRRAVEVFFPLKPRNPSRQPAARLGERKTPGRRRMRLGVRLSQPAALTDRIPPALPRESPRCPAQTAHTAPTARARQWAKEQIRAECSASTKPAVTAHPWHWDSRRMELAELQPQFPAPPEESVALAWHWIKAFGAAAHGTSPRRERADSCLSLHCSSGIQGRSHPNPRRKQLHPSAPCPCWNWGKQVALRGF